ncbi:hypothetical protein PFLmoz3_00562 [Pseudomonas fluorescens]|uniref:Uncharacterized protein n=1 Tax=Pseudomonas fluorescens TaxID=294 RepID=A0A109LLL4_PSEFL|nr:hypothetical protein PFLmoz3_00562 [Pseudomonas fluorescens]
MVATGQVQDLLRRVRRFDPHRLDLSVGVTFLPAFAQQPAKGGMGATGADVDVLSDAAQRDDALFLAILRTQQYPGGNGVAG